MYSSQNILDFKEFLDYNYLIKPLWRQNLGQHPKIENFEKVT